MDRTAQEELEQTQDAQTTATYDGGDLKLNGEVLRIGDERRGRVKHVRVLPGVTAIHDGPGYGQGTFYGCSSLSSVIIPEGVTTIGVRAFYGCTILQQRRSAAGHLSVVAYLRFISSRARCAKLRVAVIASLARLREELYARQAKRARLAYDDAVENAEEEEEEEEDDGIGIEEQAAGSLMGVLAFEVIHSDDVWRHILEFL